MVVPIMLANKTWAGPFTRAQATSEDTPEDTPTDTLGPEIDGALEERPEIATPEWEGSANGCTAYLRNRRMSQITRRRSAAM